ncbi:NAD-dependent epimerase/dehydratase family protein, partial [Escherichia coli]|nr:NAD-dependent epimerase/dehydratase family protein [Escherichia coli]
KGRVCVTGGTGFIASMIIKRLLHEGYSVNTTVRSGPSGSKKDVSFLTNLPGAHEKLQIFNADLNNPESFVPAIEGCTGVFHTASAIDYQNDESEEILTNRAIGGALGILKASINSKTVKRVVYTGSTAAVINSGKEVEELDESYWSDVDFMYKKKPFG